MSTKKTLGKSFAVRFVPGAELIVSIGGKVNVWTAQGRRKLASERPVAPPSYIDISPDGSLVAVKSTPGAMALLSLPSLAPTPHPQRKACREGSQLAFSLCGRYLIDGSWDGRLELREIESGETQLIEELAHSMITWLSHSADRHSFVYVVDLKAIGTGLPPGSQVWLRQWPFDATPAKQLEGPWRFVKAATLSADASRLAVLHQRHGLEFQLDIIDLATQERRSSAVFTYGGTNHSLAWSPDGRLLACVQKGQIAVFETESLTVIASHEDPFPCFVEFSPGGDQLAIGSWQQGWVVSISP